MCVNKNEVVGKVPEVLKKKSIWDDSITDRLSKVISKIISKIISEIISEAFQC